MKTFLLGALLVGLVAFSGYSQSGHNEGECSEENKTAHYSTPIYPKAAQVSKMKFEVFPNPAIDYFQVDDESIEKGGATKVQLFSITGTLVKEFLLEKGKLYDVSKLKVGNYLLRFSDDKGAIRKTRRLYKLGS